MNMCHVQHVVGRLWYPTPGTSSASKPEGGKAYWLPDRRYADGYAAVVFSDNGIGPSMGSCKSFAKSTFANFTWWMGSSTQLKVLKVRCGRFTPNLSMKNWLLMSLLAGVSAWAK